MPEGLYISTEARLGFTIKKKTYNKFYTQLI